MLSPEVFGAFSFFFYELLSVRIVLLFWGINWNKGRMQYHGDRSNRCHLLSIHVGANVACKQGISKWGCIHTALLLFVMPFIASVRPQARKSSIAHKTQFLVHTLITQMEHSCASLIRHEREQRGLVIRRRRK